MKALGTKGKHTDLGRTDTRVPASTELGEHIMTVRRGEAADRIRTLDVLGHEVTVDDALGKLCVAYDCAIGWEDLQKIKDAVWGPDARAIEVYPRAADVVNNGSYRHLWRLGEGDFCPDLLGHSPSTSAVSDALENRSFMAWREARRVFA